MKAMMNRITIPLVGALFASPAIAQVEFFRNIKQRTYSQTSAAAPVGPDSYSYVHDLFDIDGTLTPANIGTATVTRPDGVTNTLAANDFGVFVTFFGPTFATEAELDASLPSGDYEFAIDGGAFGTQSGTLTQADFNAWNAVPYVTNFDDLGTTFAGEDILVQFDEWTPSAETTPDRSAIFWSLTNLDTNTITTFGSAAPDGLASIILDGSSIVAGDYRFSLNFSARIEDTTDGFEGAFATQAFDSITFVEFTIVPSPGGAALITVFTITAAGRRRRS